MRKRDILAQFRRAGDRDAPGLEFDAAEWAALREMVDRHPGIFSRFAHVLEATRSELKAARQASLEDPLTGLHNRRYFEARLRDHFESMRREDRKARQTGEPGPRGALLFIDLNGFKQINDRFGHDAGDEALKAFAECLKANVRRHEPFARLAGDEFCVFLIDDENEKFPDLARRRLERAIQGLSIRYNGHDIPIRASIGTMVVDMSALYQHKTVQALLDQADRDMYAVKARSRSAGPAPG